MIAQWLPLLMFVGLALMLILGYPVAFSLAANALLFALIGIEMGLFNFALLQALPDRVFGIMRNDTLLAIPFFTFMGLILERSGMAERLLMTIGQLFGRLRGGLAFAVIAVGTLLGATTGVVAASVMAMGLISLPVMLRYGYNVRLATGVITASGTLAQIVPPSLVLIVLADQMHVSVGDMYAGALLPALLLPILYGTYVLFVAIFKPAHAPALPPEARTTRGWALFKQVLTSMLPPLALIAIVLGSVFWGWATPTEGGAMGAMGALILAKLSRRLDGDLLRQSLDSTVRLSTFVMFILIGATVFGLVFRALDGDLWVEHLLIGLPGGQLGFLVTVNLLIFVLAFFLDFFEICFILVPLLTPVASKLGIDLVWFGVLLGINMQTSFMHPPFGFALFYLRSVASKTVRTIDIYWGAVPFVLIQMLMVAIVLLFPGLIRYHKLALGNVDTLKTLQQLTVPAATQAPQKEDSTADLLRGLQGG